MMNLDGQIVREIRGLLEKLPVSNTLKTSRNRLASRVAPQLTPRTFSKTKSANRTIVLGLNIERQDESPRQFGS
jgi:hypothetical protein